MPNLNITKSELIWPGKCEVIRSLDLPEEAPLPATMSIGQHPYRHWRNSEEA